MLFLLVFEQLGGARSIGFQCASISLRADTFAFEIRFIHVDFASWQNHTWPVGLFNQRICLKQILVDWIRQLVGTSLEVSIFILLKRMKITAVWNRVPNSWSEIFFREKYFRHQESFLVKFLVPKNWVFEIRRSAHLGVWDRSLVWNNDSCIEPSYRTMVFV